ncbi:MAG: T9SS type A sorting domain-containing protein [Bacteroidetes bacterium]|nr:T9SS type A sorting domain-containing protein [Bacteroidota bacterium]
MKKVVLAAVISFSLHSAQAQIVMNGCVDKYYFNSGSTQDQVGTNHLTGENGILTGINRFGHTNSAMLLDGVDDYLHSSTPFFYPGNPYSISIWFKSNDSLQSHQSIFNTDPHRELAFEYNWYGDGTFSTGISSDASNWDLCYNSPIYLDTFFISNVKVTSWNHGVMTFDGSTWKFYVNNQLQRTCNSGTPSNVVADMLFGAIHYGFYGEFFKGYLDDIRIYNRAINSTEVDSLYHEADPLLSIGHPLTIENTVDVFPNPTTEKATCSFSKLLKNATIEVVNGMGSLVAKYTNINGKEFSLDVSNLPSGLYLIMIKEEGATLNKKIMKR